MSESLKKYALDFIVVFLGITVSFALNNLNEKRKDRISESNYYCKLLEDAQQDLINLENQIDICKDRLASSNNVLMLIQNKSATEEIVSESFSAVREMSNHFKPIKATFEDLKSSGNLKLIQDNLIKDQILNYHSTMEGYTDVISNGSQFATEIFIKKDNYINAGFLDIDFVKNSIDMLIVDLNKMKINQLDRKKFNQEMSSDAVFYVFVNSRLISLYKKILPEVKDFVLLLETKYQ